MTATLLLEGGESTYNTEVPVVQESEPLTTASQQYWAERQTLASAKAEVSQNGSFSDAEREWMNFCQKGFPFLDRLLLKAADRMEKPLRDLWMGNRKLAKDAKQLFKSSAVVELLIPYSHSPLRFVKISPRSRNPEMRALGVSDIKQSYELGKAYLGVSWKNVTLFAMTPDGHCISMDTFQIEMPDGSKWSTDSVVPDTFAGTAREFQSELIRVEAHFRPYFDALSERERSQQREKLLARIDISEKAWGRMHLPELQKVEILRAIELVEELNPAAPRGLLLTGPSGVGKSLLGKTIAETTGAFFQHLTPSSLKLDHLGGGGRKVSEVWDRARRNQPSIVYLDECEGVLGRRGAGETDALSSEIVQAFLAEWDGLQKSDHVMVIGATNRRDLLDDAILSRFGWEMEIKLPSAEDRLNILNQELMGVGVQMELPAEFAALTQGMSGRDLQTVAMAARRTAHPDVPTLEQVRYSITQLRRGRNTPVTAESKWESLVLESDVIGKLKLLSGLLRDAERWTAQGISIPRTLLLEGPSGTGKTEIARTLANESGLSFYSTTTADLKANYLGQSGNRVKQLFERARAHSPCILFLDELDIVAPDRNAAGDDPMTREIVGQLLQEIDGVQAHPEHVFLVGATNRPNAIDSAILSRFNERLPIPLPGREARSRLMAIFLKGKKLAFPVDDGAILLADLSEGKGFSGRDLRNWIGSAEQNALLRAMHNGGPEQYVITLDDFSPAS